MDNILLGDKGQSPKLATKGLYLNLVVDMRYKAHLLLMCPQATLPMSVATLEDSGGEHILHCLDSGSLEVQVEPLWSGDSELLDLFRTKL